MAVFLFECLVEFLKIMAKTFLIIAALNGFLAVALGAFGAHALKNKSPPDLMAVYQTAVQYHFYHVLALMLTAMLLMQWPDARWLKISGYSFTVGLIIFCGSLYVLAFSGIRWLGAITPIGGVAFMIGWLALAMGLFLQR
ncbi:MAG: uncharacterized membrane protein YgdD (TMEM256/DUF423 family) [Pseudohongiellaceae bacterium]